MSESILYGLPAHDVTRDFFFNVADNFGITTWGVPILFVGSLAVLAFTIVWKIIIWARGRKADVPGIEDQRVFAILKTIFLQKRIINEWYPGLMHLSFIYGFLGIILMTVIAAAQEYISYLFFGHRFLTGYAYLAWSLVSELSALLVLFGVALAILRRWILKPSRLETKMGDVFALGLIVAVVGSGLLVNALRIAMSGYPFFEIWSPASFIISWVFYFVPESVLAPLHFVMWWGHILLACVMIALAGTYKLGHITMTTINVYCAPLRKEGCSAYPADLVSESDIAAGVKGAEIIDQFTWKQMTDLSACMRCGRCQDRCPAHLTGLPLSPKKFINDLKLCMDEHNLFANGEPRPGEVKDYVKSEELWACTECGACMEFCPAHIDHVQKVIDLRRSFALRGDVPAGVSAQWKNVEEKGNPGGAAPSKRAEWMTAKNAVPTFAENPDQEYLFFAGCATAYNADAKKSANAFLALMKKADCSVGILGAEESCCGDSAMRSGNEEQFRALAKKNLEMFNKYGVKKIVVSCPHGYTVLNNEYRALAHQLGDENLKADYEVIHHTQLIAQLIAEGKLKLTKTPSPVAVFSDPCFLGRFNGIYDEPRSALKAVPGLTLVEAARSKEKAFCCGGPISWNKDPKNRIAEFRARDIHSSGAQAAVTGCPHCKTMIKAGLDVIGIENIRIADFSEFILEASGK